MNASNVICINMSYLRRQSNKAAFDFRTNKYLDIEDFEKTIVDICRNNSTDIILLHVSQYFTPTQLLKFYEDFRGFMKNGHSIYLGGEYEIAMLEALMLSDQKVKFSLPQKTNELMGFSRDIDVFNIEILMAHEEHYKIISILGKLHIQDSCMSDDSCEIVDSRFSSLGITHKSDIWKSFRKLWRQCDKSSKDILQTLFLNSCYDKFIYSTLFGSDLDLQKLVNEYCISKFHLMVTVEKYGIYKDIQGSLIDYFRTRLAWFKNRILCIFSEIHFMGNCNPTDIQSVIDQLAEDIKETRSFIIKEGMKTSQREVKHIDCALNRTALKERVAIVTTACNNEEYVTLSINSMYNNTNIDYDIFVIDYGYLNCDIGERNSIRNYYYKKITKMQKSLAVATGIQFAWDYDYILLINSDAFVLEADWLDNILCELNTEPKIGVAGICVKSLNYKTNKYAKLLLDYVNNPNWLNLFEIPNKIECSDYIERVVDRKEKTLVELTGNLQAYRGDVLRKIGMPLVQHSIFKHVHWDSELSMRALASGYGYVDSKTARHKMKYWGERYNSGLLTCSYYSSMNKDRQWMIQNGHDKYAPFLKSKYFENFLVNTL